MIKLAIDLGSSVTKIFMIGSGIVLAEPSCVAVASGTDVVKAIGEEAKQLIQIYDRENDEIKEM